MPQGGARPGSGRPRRNPPVKKRCIHLTDEHVKILRMWGRGSVSEGLRWLIDTVAPYIKRDGKPLEK